MTVELVGLPEISTPVPWHQEAWERLGEQLASDRLPHAMLLAGGEGTGKAQFALAFARLLLCAQPANGTNCGHCHACRLSAGGTHGDLCWVAPEAKSRVIKIDQVRKTVSFIHQTAGFGTRKVVVLYPADAMNNNAANALLKALEEPVPDTFLILACHRPQGLPATIRSRCQITRLTPPDTEQAVSWLQQAMDGTPEELRGLLSLVDGRPMAAAQLLQEDRVEIVAGARAAILGVLSGRMSALEGAKLLGEAETSAFLTHLQAVLQQLLRGRESLTLDRKEVRAAFAIDDEINRLRSAVAAGANPNAALLVDTLLSRCETELGGALSSDNM